MKKFFNFRNFGILCAAIICVSVLSSAVAYTPGHRICVETVMLEGHKYVVASDYVTSRSVSVAIVHAESCHCKNKR